MSAPLVHPLAGLPVPPSLLVDLPRLLTAYYVERPDPRIPGQAVAFGTSGHRGSSLDLSFNEAHVLAIAQSICDYRRRNGIDGPLFLGWDTHALSEPARVSVLEVLAGNGVEVRIDARGGFTPTPAVSLAIVDHNRERKAPMADGIVVTPSHNPPRYGGIKYDPPTGGPAEVDVSAWIGTRANALLGNGLHEVKRVPYERALRASSTQPFDYVRGYVEALAEVVDSEVLRGAGLTIGVDPLGGASLAYWEPIAERYRLGLRIVKPDVDATFRFMSVDHDGAVRMDPSSRYAMARLVALRDRFDLAFAVDPDADRHGIVTPEAGLVTPAHFMVAAIDYLFRNRSDWAPGAAVGKTVVSSRMIDRVARRLGRSVVEVPVGFKYFVGGLLAGRLGFAGEESAGATFLRRDGRVWTTDKDGIVMCLLAAEMTAREGIDPALRYRQLSEHLGVSFYERTDIAATDEQKRRLERVDPRDIRLSRLAGEPVVAITTRAAGDALPIGGVKVEAEHGWFAARPSGTEKIWKLYAESFSGVGHLARIQEDARAVVDPILRGGSAGESRERAS